MNLPITTIQPVSSSSYVSFKPRSKEGEEKKPEVYVSYSLPTALENMPDSEIKAFAIRAYESCLSELIRLALKDGKESILQPSLAECFTRAKKEYLITKADLQEWISKIIKIIQGAIASKAGLPLDNAKVIKKAEAYSELLIKLSSRSLMMQDEIDACIKVLTLITDNINLPYSENVAEAIARKQEKLNEYLSGKSESDDELDF